MSASLRHATVQPYLREAATSLLPFSIEFLLFPLRAGSFLASLFFQQQNLSTFCLLFTTPSLDPVHFVVEGLLFRLLPAERVEMNGETRFG